MLQRSDRLFRTLAILLTIGGLAWGGTYLVRQILAASPGPLTAHSNDGATRSGVKNHAELEKRCEACHPVQGDKRKPADLCLACHDEIQVQLRKPDGLHTRLGRTADCLTCHTEHRGVDAEITHVDPTSFPHDAVGFSLARHAKTRAGAAFQCEDCHGEHLTRLDAARCLDCHQKDQPDLMRQHAEALGTACNKCHDGTDRFAGNAFDHDKTSFRLTGKHDAAACERCHVKPRDLAGFRGLDATCLGCHAAEGTRAHAGQPQATADCGTCHTPVGWAASNFDHAKTGFPLVGRHATLKCVDCHGPEGASGASVGRQPGGVSIGAAPKAISGACASCHKAPGSHAAKKYGDTCETCHTPAGWAAVEGMNAANHRFPLNHGSREPVACATCHPDGTKTYTCFGCHAHEPQAMLRLHRREGRAGGGLDSIRDCVRCHRNGGDGEGEEGEEHEGDEHEGEGEEEE